MTKLSNPRETVYLAVLASVKGEQFLSDALDRWKKEKNPSTRDFKFAQEIGFGTVRLALALDFIAANLTQKKKLDLKTREKVLLRMAVYQHIYMDRVPLYAIVNETMEIAKKYCHQSFCKFLNAILRKLADGVHTLPQGNNISDLSIRYSFPPFFIQELIHNHGLHQTQTILEIENKQSPVMVRHRSTGEVKVLNDIAKLQEVASSPEYYIQNATPAALIDRLCDGMKSPDKILDLCASPGGKLISVHDHYPKAKLFANDVSEEKLKSLSENCIKYGISASLSCSRGESFQNRENFDLIILDVPCSNSGVLNKRPEARWRITPENIRELEKLQLALIKNAVSLLSKDGEIWYLTCSILKKENEVLMEKVCTQLNLKIRKMESVLPNADGWDGGFGCALQKL
jgi:16S rRNA (cytosine967-C5)-methyltransferase